MVRGAGAALVLAALVSLGGCGGSAGVQKGATVNVYLSVPLSGPSAAAGRASCKGARSELADRGWRAGDVRVRVVCLDDSDGTAPWNLAAVGADARRAVEDSSTVAYIGELEPAASRFSAPILEAAQIAQLRAGHSRLAVLRVLGAIEEAGGDSELRAALAKALAPHPHEEDGD